MSGIDNQTLLLGKLLGEVYRIQRNQDIPSVDEARVYGLLHGFESVISEELERIGFVSKAQEDHVMNVLTPYFNDPEKLAAFKGFYDIERQLQDGDVDRVTAMRILRHLNANGQFAEVIVKMDTSGSPSECRKFELSEWDK